MPNHQPAGLAILIMIASMMLIPIGDTAGKVMANSYGAAPFFIAWSRFVLGFFLLLLIAPKHLDLRVLLDWRIVLRGLLIVSAISSILTAVQTEGMALVYGAFFIGPVISYFMSVWLLGERITIPQTLLLLVGFGGVMLVVKPGFGMTVGAGFALLAGTFYGLYLVANRWLGGAAPPRALLFSQLIIGAVVLMPLGLANVPEFSWQISGLVLFNGTTSMLGNLLLILAYRQMTASKLAPFVYFQLIAATGAGYVVFGAIPDLLTMIGLALLIVSGVAAYMSGRRGVVETVSAR